MGKIERNGLKTCSDHREERVPENKETRRVLRAGRDANRHGSLNFFKFKGFLHSRDTGIEASDRIDLLQSRVRRPQAASWESSERQEGKCWLTPSGHVTEK